MTIHSYVQLNGRKSELFTAGHGRRISLIAVRAIQTKPYHMLAKLLLQAIYSRR